MSLIPQKPKKGDSILQFAFQAIAWMRANTISNVIGGKVKRSPNGVTIDVTGGGSSLNLKQGIKPPLWATLYQVGGVWKLYVEDGRVVARSNSSGDPLGTLAISGLPTKASPITVVDEDKFTIKIDTNSDGQATAATWTKTNGANWPTSTATELAGGDTSGAAGVLHVRICQVDEADAVSGALERTQIHTGHVDHFQPILCENALPTATTGNGRLVQRFRLTNGDWVFRTLTPPTSGGSPISIAEDAEKIVIDATGASFIVNIWQTDITFLSGGPGSIEIDNGSTPIATFYVFKGVWHTASPPGFPGVVTEYHVSYVTPTTGGP